jgi:hypothetical protein
MNEQKVEVTIRGASPLLMHSFPLVPIEALDKKPPVEQAELAAYKAHEKYYVPGVNVQRCLVSAASYSKGKGRGNLSRVVAACVGVEPEFAVLTPQEYEVDSRPVVVPATKGRILRHRPRFDKWELDLTISFDGDLLTEQQLRRVVDDAGSRVGLLDFRPEKRGPFGRFIVTAWKAC